MIGDSIQSYGFVIIAFGAIITVFLTDWRTRKRDQEYKENQLKEQKESKTQLETILLIYD